MEGCNTHGSILIDLRSESERSKFTKIEQGQDLQSCVAKMHLMKSTLGREIMDGPGDGQAMLDKIFQDWLSPIAIQTDLNDLA